MKKMGLFEVKNRFSEVCEEVARSGQAYVVTRRGKPLVRILPVEESRDSVWSTVAESQRQYGRITEELELPKRGITGNRPSPI